ncbi:hypothetical protein AB0B66_07985 [Catellatospora sp. NPDC049111]|uniref:hypothetical protein n=1 Tax=Catellatospora sp. NPDC049111 TaxID=3155271 RepID=UPI0033E7B49C
MEYLVTVDLEVPGGSPDLDELQMAGAGTLLSEALDRVEGDAESEEADNDETAPDVDSVEIDLIRHWVGVYPTGAMMLLVIDAPSLEAAEGSAGAIAEAVLEAVEPLQAWEIAKCEVGFNQKFVEAGLVAAEDPAAPPADLVERRAWVADPGESESPEAGPPDIDQAAWVDAHADYLQAFDLETFHSLEYGEPAARLLAGALIWGSTTAIDELFSDLEEFDGQTVADGGAFMILEDLPERFAHRYDRRFARNLLISMISVTARLADREWRSPASTAEALALRIVINNARFTLEAHELLPDIDLDEAYGRFEDEAFDDLDHELLFDPAFDGFEDDRDFAAVLGTRNMRFGDWFRQRPHATGSLHPFLVDVPPIPTIGNGVG